MTVYAAAAGFAEAAGPAAAADSPTAEYEKPNVGVPDSSSWARRVLPKLAKFACAGRCDLSSCCL